MSYKIIPAPTSTTSPTIPGASVDAGLPILSAFGDIGFNQSWILGVLDTIWLWFTILSYLFCILLLVLYVYATIRRNLYLGLMTQELRDAERLYDEHYSKSPRNSRLKDVLTHATSSNPNDWKLAIIEADIILDELLKEQGYAGASLGERLKGISAQQLKTLNDAWEAHKIRNRIAHDGSDFILTKRIAQETVVRYQRVFTELGIG